MREPIAREIIFAIGDNMREGLEPLVTKTLAPSLYQVYLHAEDFERIRTILPQIEEEAKEHLNRELVALESRTTPALQRARDRLRDRLKVGSSRQRTRRQAGEPPMKYLPAAGDWSIRFQEDPNDLLEPGEIEVISELSVPEAPSYGSGSSTQRISVSTTRRLGESRSERAPTPATPAIPTPPAPPSVAPWATLAYEDSQGAHRFEMMHDEIVIGRDSARAIADVRIKTLSDVSRRHTKIRRNPRSGGFWIEDLSQFGTEVNGRPLPTGVEVELPGRAVISLASIVTLEFTKSSP